MPLPSAHVSGLLLGATMGIFTQKRFAAHFMEDNTMYCPKCHAEYNPGISSCADCGVKLVPELADPSKLKPVEYEEVISTFNLGDVAFIESLLTDQHIEFFFQGENFNLVDPLIQPVKVYVKKTQAERTRMLLEGMNVSFLGVSGSRKQHRAVVPRTHSSSDGSR